MNSTSVNARTRRLEQAIQAVMHDGMKLHPAARKFHVPYSTLQRRVDAVRCGRIIKKKPGRPPCLGGHNENLLVSAILDCAGRGFPLSMSDISDMAQLIVSRMPESQRNRLPFRENRPGPEFVRAFLKRNKNIRMRRRAPLEQRRKMAMSPEVLAAHYARLKNAYKHYKILSPAQVFNIDESGVSARSGGRGKGKAAMAANGRSNAVELEFSANAEHVTVMPVVSADGKAWPPVVILPGTFHKYRTRSDGTIETVHNFLPHDAMVAHRSPAGMDSNLFALWVERFIQQTAQLRQKYKYLLVTMDACGAHLSYRALHLLAENNILAYALPAHTSHRTQVLDYSVFSPLKAYIRSQWSKRLHGTQAQRANDCFTLCEILHKAYLNSVTYKNIVNGFDACGVWSLRGGGVDETVIKAPDITNRALNESAEQSYTRYSDLVKDYFKSRDVFQSDGPNLVNGHLNTTSGALLYRDDLLRDLRVREAERAAERLAREEREAERVARRSQRAQEADEAQRRRAEASQQRVAIQQEREAARLRKEREKEAAKRAMETNRVWDLNIQERWKGLSDSRASRRAAARLRRQNRQTDTTITSQGNN